MILRWRPLAAILWAISISAALAEDFPPGLVTKNSDKDLLAEATQPGESAEVASTVSVTEQRSVQAQKREATLSNSYGEPLPFNVYGPPKDLSSNIIPDFGLPAPVYGVPEHQHSSNYLQQSPPGTYGPPSPVVFPNQNYEGPPPPVSKPKLIYGPPKPIYGPPKQSHPKPIYGPPKNLSKQNLPKSIYGAPFKPPKITFPKAAYGIPKPIYGPPKPVYGPPKPVYGPPKNNDIDISALPAAFPLLFGDQSTHTFNVGTNIDFNLPAPIYGTPFPNLKLPELKPNFPLPIDTYGPPGHPLGPVGSNNQLFLQEIENIGHYGPPQPDPNPKPPHPGIPAPPTPPHVLYDGWKPIPGISKPVSENAEQNIGDQYGPPPPPPPPVQEIHIEEYVLDGQNLPNINSGPEFSNAQITTGYSNVHHDALADIDLNAIVGGDSNHIDQSKTVFEAHYTENTHGNDFANNNGNVAIVHASSSTALGKPFDSYSAPPSGSFSNGPYPPSIRQFGAKGLVPPSGIYGVPPNSQYGAPPRRHPAHLPIPYGSYSGGGHSIHTGGNTPKHPIKFRDPIPEGLIQQIGQTVQHKDMHALDHIGPGPAYLSPPIKDVKDINQHTDNYATDDISLSIEPSNLFSLPHTGNPINFQSNHQFQSYGLPLDSFALTQQVHAPNNLYGSSVDSYSVPLLTVGDHITSGSNKNSVTATVDGKVLSNLTNQDVAAILKHCPYHEAILKAAQKGEKIPADLASKYVASLSSLGSSLTKSQQTLISPHNGFNAPEIGSESVSYSTQDLSTASHSLVETILPSKEANKNFYKNNKGKSIKDIYGKHNFKNEDNFKHVSQQILQTSEKIKNLGEETKRLQHKIAKSNHNINQVHGQLIQNLPGIGATYAVQIQSADGNVKKDEPSIPHDQLLSEGLLQSILQAIEQPAQYNIANQKNNLPNVMNYGQSNTINLLDNEGITLPDGYEPFDRSKVKFISNDLDVQSTNTIKNQQTRYETSKPKDEILECDLKTDNSIRHEIIVSAPKVDETIVEEIDDNDVAIYFSETPKTEKEQSSESVTEISVATSISEGSNEDNSKNKKSFQDKET